MRNFLLVVSVLSLAACATQSSVTDEIVWEDDDRHPIEQPKEYWSPLVWDGADMTFFRPITRGLLLDDYGPAKNTNALGEVPNSSWYSNRMALTQIPVDRLIQSACEKLIDTNAVWEVRSGKVDGLNPGFVIKDLSDGRRYLLKFDSADQQERATAADVIGSKVYWAAGFSVPCNELVYFEEKNLKIADDATKKDAIGRKTALTQDDVTNALSGAPRRADGRVRASSSLFITGRPIGPFKYQGTRSDDPNDVIPHEDRRELRGSKVLAAWLNHFDAREQNTLTSFVSGEGGRGYVQHYIIDWGDTLGSTWPADQMNRRFGHSWYFDITHVLPDLLLLGSIIRPWERAKLHPEEGSIFAYFEIDGFKPRKWRNGYPNPAFARMDDVDAYWGAKIVSRFSDEHIAALVGSAELSDEGHARYLTKTLIGRRDKVVEAFLTRVSAFDSPSFVQGQFCVEDLLVSGGYAAPSDATYEARRGPDEPWAKLAMPGDGTRVCAAPAEHLELRVRRRDERKPAKPVVFSFRQRRGVWKLIRIER